MNYFLLGDILWYMGHLISTSSIIFSRTNYHAAITLTLCGQLLIVISRPIGRINLNNKTALKENA